MQNRPSANRIWFVIVLFLIVAGAIAYFVGGIVERRAGDADVATAERQVDIVKTQLQDVQTKLSAAQSTNKLLGASVLTYRAMVALDNRNFGVANDDVAKALASLNAIGEPGTGIDGAALSALKKQAAGVKIRVATDLESQRTQLLHLATSINALVPASQAPTR